MITQLCVRQIIKYYISLYGIFGFTSRKCFNYLMVNMAKKATNHHFTHETFSIHKQKI